MRLSTQTFVPEAAGSVPAGAVSVAVVNTSSNPILFDGCLIPAGYSVNYPPVAGGEYPAIVYDPTTGSMILTVIRTI